MRRGRTALVVPCYNESGRLPAAAFEGFLDGEDATLVFVNDGSTDGTADVLEGIRARHDRVHVVTLSRNSGKAEAVRRGLSFAMNAGFDYAGFWDADLATPLDCVRTFESLLVEQPGLDMVFGARVRLLGRSIERRATRHHLGRAFATAVSLTLGFPIYDSQCGAKLFRNTEVMREILRQPFLSRWIFDVEIIARYAARIGSSAATERRIYEYPLPMWRDVSGSKLKAGDFLVSFLDLFRIGWTYRISSTDGRRAAVVPADPHADVHVDSSRYG